jgi:hypothetical protein
MKFAPWVFWDVAIKVGRGNDEAEMTREVHDMIVEEGGETGMGDMISRQRTQ